MKKEIKIVAVVLVAVLVFVTGFGLGASKGINININSTGTVAAGNSTEQPTTPPATTTQAEQPTTPPATTTQAEQPTTPSEGGDTTPATTEATQGGSSAAGVPSSKEEIVAKYNELINGAKNLQAGTMHKVSNTTIEITDLPVASLKGTVNNIVQGLVKPSDETFTYNGGASEDGGHPIDHITPGGREVKLDPAGAAEATATPDGDGYKIHIKLVSEKSTYDGTTTVNPVHHESCLSPLNLATLDISPATITSADMTYPGATLDCTVDGQGRLTYYEFHLPLEGSGAGKLGLSLTLGLGGEMVETYEISY